MQQSFEIFKKRIWLHIHIKCAVIAALAGFAALVATLLPCKLFGVNLLWIFYVLITLGGGALGFGIAFLLLRTNDTKIARRLDEELNLNERTVTALIYSEREGEMYSAQREDAASALEKLPARALRFRHLVATLLCAVCALCLIVAVPVVATSVPPVFAKTEVPEEEPKRDVTDWEWQALDELIEYVRKTRKADELTKSLMLNQLLGLRGVLEDGVSQSSLTVFVENTVVNIRNGVRDINEAVTGEQKTANTEESAYVISRLYEIFRITPKNNDDGNSEKPPEQENPSGGNTGTGELNISDLPFFDRELGFVKCGEVRDEYYAKAMQALQEGLLTQEEWATIVATYFTDLNGDT